MDETESTLSSLMKKTYKANITLIKQIIKSLLIKAIRMIKENDKRVYKSAQ